jgi:5-hydroxyisourate hydrolase
MSRLSTHVLDVALGRPASGVPVRLEVLEGESWRLLATDVTDADGRARDLLAGAALLPRTYRLTFETGAYFQSTGRAAFYPRVEVTFQVTAPGEPHHVPLLLSPFGYSTYRGS